MKGLKLYYWVLVFSFLILCIWIPTTAIFFGFLIYIYILFFFVIDIELSSKLEFILSIPVHGDSESIYEAVDRINNNVDLREGLVQSCHMDMVSANVGSVVLKLVPLTDDACRELLAEEGAKVKKMMKILLKHSNLRKEMIGGVIEVKVLISGNKAQGTFILCNF